MKTYAIYLEDFSYRGQLENLLHEKVSFFSKKSGEDVIVYVVTGDVYETVFGDIPVRIVPQDDINTDDEDVPFPQPEPDRDDVVSDDLDMKNMIMYAIGCVVLLTIAIILF